MTSEKPTKLRESIIRGASSLSDDTKTQISYTQRCAERGYSSQLLLLAKNLHLRQIINQSQFSDFVKLLRNAKERTKACEWLSKYYFFHTIVELDEALAEIDCLFVQRLKMYEMDIFVEFLRRDGLLSGDEDLQHPQVKCAKIVEALSLIPPIDKQSTESQRRLDSLLSIGEPDLGRNEIILGQPNQLLEGRRAALQQQKSLWPAAQSLQTDVDNACRRYFAESTATAAAKEATMAAPTAERHDQTQILHQIAAVFFDDKTIEQALFGNAQDSQFDKTAQEMATVLQKLDLSAIGREAQTGRLGEQERQSVELCLLLSHPILQSAMQYVGPVQHLTDDVIARLRRAERKFALLYAQKNVKKYANDSSIGQWLWNKASSLFSGQSLVGKESSSDAGGIAQWQLAKKLLFAAAVIAMLPVATATAQQASAKQMQLVSGGLAAASGAGGAAAVDIRQRQQATSLERQSGFSMPATVPAARAQQFYGKTVDVLPITKLLTSIVPYGGSLQTRLVKRNLCSLLGGSTNLFGSKVGQCEFGGDAVLYNLPEFSADTAQASQELLDWLNQFYATETVVGVSDEAQVSIVTPNGAALGFMFDPRTHTAGAKIVAALTPFLTEKSQRTVQDLMVGGSAFFPDPSVKSYDFPPANMADVRFAKEQCSQLMKQYGEAVQLHQVLFVAPTRFETPQQFDQRLRTLDLFLQRCAADIANVAQFVRLCPPTADGSEPSLECQLQLQQLEARLIRDITVKQEDAKAWEEWAAYNDFVHGVEERSATGDTVGAIVALVRSHMSRHRIPERVAAFVQAQMDAVKGSVLFDDIPDETDTQQRRGEGGTAEQLLAKAYEAAAMTTAWLNRLANLAARNVNALSVLLGTPLVLLLLFRLSAGKRLQQNLADTAQRALQNQIAEDRALAERIEQKSSSLQEFVPIVDQLKKTAPSDTNDSNLVEDNRQLRQQMLELAEQLKRADRVAKKSKIAKQKWQKEYAKLAGDLDRAMTGGRAYMANPQMREQFVRYLTDGEFDKAQMLTEMVVRPDKWSRDQAKRLATISPESYERANAALFGDNEYNVDVELALKNVESNINEQIKQLILRRPTVAIDYPEVAAGYIIAAMDTEQNSDK